MKKRVFWLVWGFAVSFFAGFFSYVEAQEAQFSAGRDFVIRSDKLMRGETSSLKVEFLVKTPKWERVYQMQSYFKGLDHAFVRTLAPAKYKNQTYLRLSAKMWQYLPAAEREILIPPSMMLDKFLGSDFTNDDFVKQSYYARDYTQKILNEEMLDTFPAYKIENLPNPEAAVTYGKILSWYRKADAAPLKEEYYDERGKLLKTQFYSEFKKFNDREIPTVWRMVNSLKPGSETTIRILDAVFNTPISDTTFTRKNLANEV